MALVKFPCGCKALEVDDEFVIVVYDCAGDEDSTIPGWTGLTKRAYFRRHWEGLEARPATDPQLTAWIETVNKNAQEADTFRGLKSAVKALLP